MMDVQGTSLTAEDKELIQHPLVGGLILFSRNFHSISQLTQLVADIRDTTCNEMLIAVDHEGGRVQRFRQGFSQIPAMGSLFDQASNDLTAGCQLAKKLGSLMAMEVQAVGIDISFAPVLDLDGVSEVIGQRSFHADPNIVIAMATAFIDGMHSVGMKATGKHFPGHGSVQADSHIDLPIDERSFEDIFQHDLLPFKALIKTKHLDALMPAHVIYPSVDNKSVGFSAKWLQQILRQQLKFNGVIFSDDLSMEAASSIGGYIERTEAAQAAGCDMLLLCNNRAACIEVLDRANINVDAISGQRIKNMLKTRTMNWSQLQANPRWQQLTQMPEL